MTLFPYQFDVIPVELISSIYEQFAHADPVNTDTGTETDVFYTRLSLVSLVLDEVIDGLTGAETVLDLTCGSGVFLVEALRRLVRLRANGGAPSRELIRSTLHRQIQGIDVSEAAVRVAAFSLYLAALELDPNPRPPQALRFEPLIGKTLIVGDAWAVEHTPEGNAALTAGGETRKFDVIVGNPPWSYRGKTATTTRRRRRAGDSAQPPRGESLDFVFRAMDFASDETRFGLVLSAVQFFSRSTTGATASRRLVEALSPVTLVNLANQSTWLFPRGNMPAVVLLARRRDSRPRHDHRRAGSLVSGRRTEPYVPDRAQRRHDVATGRLETETGVPQGLVLRVPPRPGAARPADVKPSRTARPAPRTRRQRCSSLPGVRHGRYRPIPERQVRSESRNRFHGRIPDWR